MGKYIGFDKLKAKLGAEKGVTDPGALAAKIGRKKYGSKAFNKSAKSGTSMKGMKPQHVVSKQKGMSTAKGQASALENM